MHNRYNYDLVFIFLRIALFEINMSNLIGSKESDANDILRLCTLNYAHIHNNLICLETHPPKKL